jgi:hypothetical protein
MSRIEQNLDTTICSTPPQAKEAESVSVSRPDMSMQPSTRASWPYKPEKRLGFVEPSVWLESSLHTTPNEGIVKSFQVFGFRYFHLPLSKSLSVSKLVSSHQLTRLTNKSPPAFESRPARLWNSLEKEKSETRKYVQEDNIIGNQKNSRGSPND